MCSADLSHVQSFGSLSLRQMMWYVYSKNRLSPHTTTNCCGCCFCFYSSLLSLKAFPFGAVSAVEGLMEWSIIKIVTKVFRYRSAMVKYFSGWISNESLTCNDIVYKAYPNNISLIMSFLFLMQGAPLWIMEYDITCILSNLCLVVTEWKQSIGYRSSH